MLTKNSPNRQAIDALGGISIGMFTVYFLFSLPELLQGNFYLNTDLLGGLSLVALIVLLYSWYEARQARA